jgi:uncharacterized protein YkwD/uncharacterized protein YgiM (DUF1202 family)
MLVSTTLLLLASGSIAATAPVPDAVGSEPTFSTGQSVTVTESTVALQDESEVDLSPGPNGRIVGEGTEFKDGIWYEVELRTSDGAETYWIPQRALDAYDGDVTSVTTTRPAFEQGDAVVVEETVRAWHGDLRMQVQEGLRGRIVSGPSDFEDDVWYEIETRNGTYWIPDSKLDDAERLSTSTTTVTTTATPAAYAPGDAVSVDKGTRTWRGGNETVIEVTLHGEVVAGPTEYNNSTWYEVTTHYGQYWVPEAGLSSSETPFTTTTAAPVTFDRRDSVRISKRAVVWKGDRKTRLQTSLHGEIVAGPTEYEGKDWYKIKTNRDVYWVSVVALTASEEEFTTTTALPAKYQLDDLVRLVRDRKAWIDNEKETVERGTRAQIVTRPTEHRGEYWYVLETADARFSVPEHALEGYEPRYHIGDAVVLPNETRVWYDGRLVPLPAGTTGEVFAGPYENDGKIWYQLRASKGRIWVAQRHLAAHDGTTEAHNWTEVEFTPGDGVKVTQEAIARRRGNQTTLPGGFSGTIYGGPVTYRGAPWYHVQSDGVRYWIPAEILAPTGAGNASLEQGTEREYDLDEVETHFIAYLNEERRERGLQRVYRRNVLSQMGRAHSVDMARNDYVDHQSTSGASVRDRYEDRGLLPECRLSSAHSASSSFYPGAEILAWVDDDAGDTHTTDDRTLVRDEESLAWILYRMWMQSLPHRKALTLQAADQAGLGLSVSEDGKIYASLELC